MTAILIVDDSKLARIVVGKALTALQPEWERLEAGSADEALSLLEGRDVDVVILDYNMPGRSGLDLAEELRSQYPTMPIAMATANVQDEVIARARAASVAFVPKPINEDALRGFISGAALALRSATP